MSIFIVVVSKVLVWSELCFSYQSIFLSNNFIELYRCTEILYRTKFEIIEQVTICLQYFVTNKTLSLNKCILY